MGATGPATPPHVIDRLARRKLLIISGKGGVGRTTTAALLGLAIARRGRRVLVATVGHDDRLAWMLGADRLEPRPLQVGSRLWIQRLEPATCIREYGALILRSQRASSAVFGNRVVRKLLSALPGVDDFATLGKVWHEAVRADDFDTVVFDGPTTGHVQFTLGVPQAIISAIGDGPLTRDARLVQACLEDPDLCQCVLVGLPEQWPLTELGELAAALRRDVRASLGCIVVNGMWPSTPPVLSGSVGRDPPNLPVAAALERVDAVCETGRHHRVVVDEWLGRSPGQHGVIEIPWRFGGLTSRSMLEDVVQTFEPGQEVA